MQVPVLIGGHTGMALAGHPIITGAIPGIARGGGPTVPLGIRTPPVERQPHLAGMTRTGYYRNGDSPGVPVSPSSSFAAAIAAESVPWPASAVAAQRCDSKGPSESVL